MSRFLHSQAASALFNANKSMLAKLRKKTGYTFSNCKKALELYPDDLIKAEKWLQEQAQSLGWTKVAKLEGRSAKQGLIGIGLDNSQATLVEINCETDFVARNDKFLSLVEQTIKSCLAFNRTLNQTNEEFNQIILDKNQLAELKNPDSGMRLSDLVALCVGDVSENISLRRAVCVNAPPSSNILLSGYGHPSNSDLSLPIMMGRFGSLVALEGNAQPKLARDICQHIIGFNPEKIGNLETDKPHDNIDHESCLIYQEYLLDPERLVKDVLNDEGVSCKWFARYKCGEQVETENEENCQIKSQQVV